MWSGVNMFFQQPVLAENFQYTPFIWDGAKYWHTSRVTKPEGRARNFFMCSHDSQCSVPAWPLWCLSLPALYSCRLPVTLLLPLSTEGQQWNVAFVLLSLSNWNMSGSSIQSEQKIRQAMLILLLYVWKNMVQVKKKKKKRFNLVGLPISKC